MNFVTVSHTDVGIRKKTNQDSYLIEQVRTENGNILFAAVCDGMGGLAKGEVASGSVIQRLSYWFYHDFPVMLKDGFSPEKLHASWSQLVDDANQRIGDYGREHDISLGTTCVALLAFDQNYYIMNVGDSRAYLLSDSIYQLTKDQSFCQREIDCGRMTLEQAAVDPQRSVLLQCIGASDVVVPDFFIGDLESGQCFLMCSDGFAHMISPSEIYERLCYWAAADAATMKNNLVYLVELDKERLERDNITALLLKTC